MNKFAWHSNILSSLLNLFSTSLRPSATSAASNKHVPHQCVCVWVLAYDLRGGKALVLDITAGLLFRIGVNERERESGTLHCDTYYIVEQPILAVAPPLLLCCCCCCWCENWWESFYVNINIKCCPRPEFRLCMYVCYSQVSRQVSACDNVIVEQSHIRESLSCTQHRPLMCSFSSAARENIMCVPAPSSQPSSHPASYPVIQPDDRN